LTYITQKTQISDEKFIKTTQDTLSSLYILKYILAVCFG